MSLPTKVLIEQNKLHGKILDFGCGMGKDVDLLKNRGLDITGYDPYYFKDAPKDKYDTIICNYVLNILLQEEQVSVLMSISELIKTEGRAYFAVRRDIKRNRFIYNPKHKVKTYQCNVILPFKSIFKTDNCEIYEYKHYTTLNIGKEAISPFFTGNEIRKLVTESATAFSILDKYPVSNGHSLVIPKRKVSDFFKLSNHEQNACLIMVNRVRNILFAQFKPQGFNVGINDGIIAGQSIKHAHIHIIPRYPKDVRDPEVGIRNIIPLKEKY
jgi:diadenosine tetraphosphate (Ap4A) HIT family hydrolase